MEVADGWRLRCIGCGREYGSDVPSFRCTGCSDLLELVKTRPLRRERLFLEGQRGVWRYRAALPVGGRPVSMGEGGTPLVKSAQMAASAGVGDLYFKVEGQNPTGSFKDRGMTVAVTRAVQSKARVLICASTGNTSASLAAYAARAGLKSAVVIPAGKVAKGKLVQAVACGASIIRVGGNFDRALEMAVAAGAELPWLYLVNSMNPYRVEGQKTCAYEIYEQLGGRAPDYVVLPVGNAGNISAVWKGFKELVSWGIIRKAPKLVGVQASGASPIARAIREGSDSITPVEEPETEASAIRIGRPVSWKKALRAIRESGGTAVEVTDDQIRRARAGLASREGVFVEPASAAPVAGLTELKGRVRKDDAVVCINTGHGLKDQESVEWDPQGTPLADDGGRLRALLAEMAGR